jgi:CO/xanthine dehydrogenase FAD-binding subunit
VRRLKPFVYFEPTKLSKVFEILAEEGERASLLAGGTDLLVRMKKGEITPPALRS